MGTEKTLGFKIQIDGVSNESAELEKLSFQIGNLKKEKADLLKQSKAEGILSTENKLKLAAYTKEINTQEVSLKTLKRVVDTASDSLARKKALLIELTAKSDKATQAIRDGMAPAILKLNNEIKAGENARGVFSRNVGNYPQLAQQAGGAMNELSSAIGGVAGETGSVIASFLTAGGVVGVLSAAVGVLAKAWKTTQENIKLYLETADKAMLGVAGFEQDAENARKDARKRAEGQVAEGLRLSGEYQGYLLRQKGLTEEQKKYYQSMVDTGNQMVINGRRIVTDTYGLKNKLEWERKYNALLLEQEQLADNKLEKETEWEKLEANLIKQRAIVSAQEKTTIAEKKKAAIDADIIANKLVKDKTDFLDMELANLQAIAEMTGLQEKYKDSINGMLKERNTIQKEYYSDQVKINRLEKTANKGGTTKGGVNVSDDPKQAAKDLLDLKKANAIDTITLVKDTEESSLNVLREYTGLSNEEIKKRVKFDLETVRKSEETKKEIQVAAIQGIQQGADAAFNAKKSRLQAEMEAELAKDNLTESQKVAIRKKYAKEQRKTDITQAIINTALAIGSALQTKPFMPMGLIAAALAGVTGGIQVATIAAAKYARGGKINRGVPINTGTVDDTLIAVNKTETVLTQRHVAALGGSGVMRRIGVPGYANGGYIGQQAPVIPSQGFDINELARMINSIEVTLNTNKVISSINEVQVINQTQRI
jgi:hypothetical protein